MGTSFQVIWPSNSRTSVLAAAVKSYLYTELIASSKVNESGSEEAVRIEKGETPKAAKIDKKLEAGGKD